MKRAALPLLLLALPACALNPFKKDEPIDAPPFYKATTPKESEASGKSGVENVLFYMKREFKPLSATIVLNSYDGFVIDAGRKDGVSVGDRFISESGAVLKVREVKNEYSIALPTLGNPMVGEKVEKLLFSKVLYLDFTKEKGKELYEKLKEEVSSLNLAPYEEGEKFKEKFGIKFPSDFKRKVPVDKLTGYDGYLVITDLGAQLYDGTKRLVKVFPWEGAPQTSYALSSKAPYQIALDLKKEHATSLFVANLDASPSSELLLSTEDSLLEFRITPAGLKRTAKFKNPFRGSYLFHVCPIDTDGDGISEFLINGFYQEEKSVSSGLFKIEDGSLKKVAQSSLIISCFDTDGDGVNDAIYGQEVSPERDKLFGKRVWELSKKDLKRLKQIEVPKEFQATSAQLFKSGGKLLFAYYDLDYFFNVSDGKTLIWRSPIQIGASPNVLYWYDEDVLVSYYITPKPKPIDVDGDGEEEILFSQNKNAVPGILRNIYTFDGGRILLLYRSGASFDWQEATAPIYKLGGIEEFDYIPSYDLFVAIFTEAGILKRPSSKLLLINPKI